jgi:hypothetical protein
MSLITLARRTIIPALKANSAVTSIVPAERIYPAKTPNAPVYPFIRYGTATLSPHTYSCPNNGTVSGMMHCFVQQSDATPDPEITCSELSDAVAECISGLGEGYATSVQILQDATESDVFHGIIYFDLTVHEARP